MDSHKTFKKPYGELSLLDFQDQFPDEKSCWDYLIKVRWPQGIHCSKCKNDKMGFVQTRKLFQCKKCFKQYSVTTGTVFHKSRLPLRKWFWAIFLMATSKKGISMLYLQRQLGIKSYRAVWMMGQKIRHAMIEREELYTLTGTVQTDEIFIGGKKKGMYSKGPASNKTPFLMTVSETEDGKRPRFVKIQELEDITKKYVIPAIELGVEPGSLIKTDGANTYHSVKAKGYGLKQSSYNQDPAGTTEHLKWLNMLTSNLKRFLISTYHGVFPHYRSAYLAEFAYRFNRRYWPYQAFDRLLYACVNAKQITLTELRS
jgi:transposase-like protein